MNQRMRVPTYRLLSIFIFGVLAFSYAQSDDLFIKGLRRDDTSQLHVVVEGLHSDAAAIGLTRERIEDRVLVRLAQVGIDVVPSNQFLEDGAYLYVNVGVLNRAVSLSLEFNRFVTFTANGTEVGISATTWNLGGLATTGAPDSGEGDYVMSLVDQLLDSFLADYLRANR